ncbi:hypothetical protein CYMTET_34540, partial [Cymbomonas tetramitiformis]
GESAGGECGGGYFSGDPVRVGSAEVECEGGGVFSGTLAGVRALVGESARVVEYFNGDPWQEVESWWGVRGGGYFNGDWQGVSAELGSESASGGARVVEYFVGPWQGESAGGDPDAAILLSVTELPRGDGVEGSPQIGVCALDAAVGLFQLCQFTDDGLRSTLRNIFAQLRPVELLMPREGLSEETAAAIHSSFQGTLQRRLDAGTQMWEAERTMHELREGGYFGAQGDAFPELLTELEGAGVHGEAALSAFGGCVFHLKDFAQLDRELLPLRCAPPLRAFQADPPC